MGGSEKQWCFSKSTNSPLFSFKSREKEVHRKLELSPTPLQKKLRVEKQKDTNFPFPTPHWQNNDKIITAPTGPVVGFTDLKNSSNISTGPYQLTIFYNGSVCVYNNVLPEKAQAIMLLAGDGNSKNPNCVTFSPTPINQHPNELASTSNPPLGFSSPVPFAPTPIVSARPLTIASSCILQVSLIKPVLVPVPAQVSKSSYIPKLRPTVGVARPSPSAIPSAVPQARKASIARFLEKRKDRVVSASSPYTVNKNAF